MKNRILCLDYVRAIATCLIILTHYNAVFLYMPEPNLQAIVGTAYIDKLYIGDWGVSLFLVLSGASLMYVSQKKFNVWNFYKKRFLTIYPLYWFVYVITMSYLFLKYQTINPVHAEKYKIVLSIIGFDSYLNNITAVWSGIGEWFLGLIILLYIIFPLLYYMLQKHERLLVLLAICVYALTLKYYSFSIYPSTNVLIRIPEFIFGMLYVKHNFKESNKVIIMSVVVILLDLLIRDKVHVCIRTSYLGVSAFVIICRLSEKFIKEDWKICRVLQGICKYSFVVFLIHHRIIWEVTSRFNLVTLSKMDSFMLFGVCTELIFLLSVFLYQLFTNAKKLVWKTREEA